MTDITQKTFVFCLRGRGGAVGGGGVGGLEQM